MIIYKVFYKEYKIFEISVYLERSDVKPTKGLYYSDLKTYIDPEGMAHFIFEDVKTSDDLQKAIRRCQDINDMRVMLWEDTDFDNSPLLLKRAEERHYSIVIPEIEHVLKEFCDLYPGKFGVFTD